MKVRLHGGELPVDVTKLPGLLDLRRYDIEEDDEREVDGEDDACRGYVYIESEPGARDSVRAALKQDVRVRFCSTTTGPCNLIAMLAGESFGELNATISNHLHSLPGVLRMKHDWIINLYSL